MIHDVCVSGVVSLSFVMCVRVYTRGCILLETCCFFCGLRLFISFRKKQRTLVQRIRFASPAEGQGCGIDSQLFVSLRIRALFGIWIHTLCKCYFWWLSFSPPKVFCRDHFVPGLCRRIVAGWVTSYYCGLSFSRGEAGLHGDVGLHGNVFVEKFCVLRSTVDKEGRREFSSKKNQNFRRKKIRIFVEKFCLLESGGGAFLFSSSFAHWKFDSPLHYREKRLHSETSIYIQPKHVIDEISRLADSQPATNHRKSKIEEKKQKEGFRWPGMIHTKERIIITREGVIVKRITVECFPSKKAAFESTTRSHIKLTSVKRIPASKPKKKIAAKQKQSKKQQTAKLKRKRSSGSSTSTPSSKKPRKQKSTR